MRSDPSIGDIRSLVDSLQNDQLVQLGLSVYEVG
jgi:hypothetical protein